MKPHKMTQPHIVEIQRAKKRCLSMGKDHKYDVAYECSKLAPIISNYCSCIENEYNNDKDYSLIYSWISHISCGINSYCDSYKVVGDESTEYWLCHFLKFVDVVADLDYL